MEMFPLVCINYFIQNNFTAYLIEDNHVVIAVKLCCNYKTMCIIKYILTNFNTMPQINCTIPQTNCTMHQTAQCLKWEIHETTFFEGQLITDGLKTG